MKKILIILFLALICPPAFTDTDKPARICQTEPNVFPKKFRGPAICTIEGEKILIIPSILGLGPKLNFKLDESSEPFRAEASFRMNVPAEEIAKQFCNSYKTITGNDVSITYTTGTRNSLHHMAITYKVSPPK